MSAFTRERTCRSTHLKDHRERRRLLKRIEFWKRRRVVWQEGPRGTAFREHECITAIEEPNAPPTSGFG